MLYDLIPNMPENRLKPLVERYAELLHQSRVVSETFAIVTRIRGFRAINGL